MLSPCEAICNIVLTNTHFDSVVSVPVRLVFLAGASYTGVTDLFYLRLRDSKPTKERILLDECKIPPNMVEGLA